MDKITATKVFEEELRKIEFEGIENIIEGYKNPFKPEAMNLLGVIFMFDHDDKMCCDRYYIVTFVTNDKIYYKRLYAHVLGHLRYMK